MSNDMLKLYEEETGITYEEIQAQFHIECFQGNCHRDNAAEYLFRTLMIEDYDKCYEIMMKILMNCYLFDFDYFEEELSTIEDNPNFEEAIEELANYMIDDLMEEPHELDPKSTEELAKILEGFGEEYKRIKAKKEENENAYLMWLEDFYSRLDEYDEYED